MIDAAGPSSSALFPGAGRKPGPLTIAATLKLVKELHPGITAHGFRSTFRDWAADQTSHSRDVAEMALAHTIKDKSEAAYRRSDMLERRAKLMQDWATFATTVPEAGPAIKIAKKAHRR